MEKIEKVNAGGFEYIKTTDENGRDIFLYPPTPDEPQHQTIEEDSPIIIQSPRGLNNAGIMGANGISKTVDLGLNLRGSFDIETDTYDMKNGKYLEYGPNEIKYTPELSALGEIPTSKKIIMGYDINDKPFEIVTDVTDAGNIELFTEEQIPIIVKMLHVLENQGAETLWSMMTPEMYELAMNHSILSYELEEYYIEDDNKYNLVIDEDLNNRYGLTISIFGKDYDE